MAGLGPSGLSSQHASMPARPDSSWSCPESAGVETVATQGNVGLSDVADSVAGDITSGVIFEAMAEGLRSHSAPSAGRPSEAAELAQLRNRCSEMQVQLSNAAGEAEQAALREQELEERNKLAQRTIAALSEQVESLAGQNKAVSKELQDVKKQLAAREDRLRKADEATAQSSVVESLQAELEETKATLIAAEHAKIDLVSKNSELENQVAALQPELERFKKEAAEAERLRQELIAAKESAAASAAAAAASIEAAQEAAGQPLQDAYQQISVLNTQLAHLYKELTLARTDGARSGPSQDGSGEQGAADAQADVLNQQKQRAQIADLVSDIRHLQLDLEYHQQKLEGLLEEKQRMMADLKKSQAELVEAKQQIETRDQTIRHREVDLQHLQQQVSRLSGDGSQSGSADEGMLVALRAEASAKDSALIVAHYELHKEKLLRDRLEQKNLKLLERMQKLMMVVETMRRENVTLERTVVAKDQAHEEKQRQLQHVAQKAKQLQRLVRSPRQGKGADKKAVLSLELESPHPPPPVSRASPPQTLPPVGTPRQLSRTGSRSGRSTPRTPRGTSPSPYGARSGATL